MQESAAWPNDVEVPLRGGFVDFGDLSAADVRVIADELDENTSWGVVSAADAGQPTTDARLWRTLATELEDASAERVRDLPAEVREATARALKLPQRGWALRAKRRANRYDLGPCAAACYLTPSLRARGADAKCGDSAIRCSR